jgi:hypothetical protein
MDRVTIAQHLAETEREVAEDSARVERHRAIVKELAGEGRNYNEAFSELIRLEERLALHMKDRDWFLKALVETQGE